MSGTITVQVVLSKEEYGEIAKRKGGMTWKQWLQRPGSCLD